MASSMCMRLSSVANLAAAASAVIQERRSNSRRGNGLLKDYGERSGHTNFRREYAGIDDDTMLPHYFLHPLAPPSRPRTSRLASVRRLRKMERRTMWLQTARYSVSSWILSLSRFNPFRTYGDQLRFKARPKARPVGGLATSLVAHRMGALRERRALAR